MRSAALAGVTVERFWQLTPAELCIEIASWDKRQEMEDYRIGLICAVMAEPHRDAKKHKHPFTPQDFMPLRDKEDAGLTQKQDWQQQLDIVEKLNKAFGGEDLRR
ncbi:MAG: hypothetical protein ACM3PE_07575 [Deltaproteobacteria bacterium]